MKSWWRIILLTIIICLVGILPVSATEINGHDPVRSMETDYATQFSVDYYEDGNTLLSLANGQQFLIIPENADIPDELPAGIVPVISGSFAVFSVITVFLLAPVGTENKPLGRRQSGQLKRDSRLIALTLCLVTLSLLFLPVSPQWPFSVSFAASAVSFSLILGKVKLTGFRPDPDKS